MGEKIVVGPVNKGLTTNVTAFNIDNDAFPTLVNAYQWRGRVKRKRGTSPINRARRFFNSSSTSYNSGSATITLNGAGTGNLLSGFGLQVNGALSPGTVVIVGLDTYRDTNGTTSIGQGVLFNAALAAVGTINYATGSFTIPTEANNAVSATFQYFPMLPAMGFRDVQIAGSQWIGNLAFDTKYSYNVLTAEPYPIYDVSFYKNPSVVGAPINYVPKTAGTSTSWNGQDYQQFWTINYQGALWATNGVNVPFSVTNIGMPFKPITGLTYVAGPPAVVTLTIVAHGLVIGDYVFLNEIAGNTGVNLQTGYVTAVTDANTVVVTLPEATVAGAYTSGGIAQYLTSRSDITKDCIRWYDGDPTNGNFNNPTLQQGKGWVNFCPPLSNSNYSISDLPQAQYYLVGAKLIQNFKDRLLFLGPVVQTSSGSPIYLKDAVIYSQNGTPYYTSSFTGNPLLVTTVQTGMLLPTNQTASTAAWFGDVAGFGGWISPGLDQTLTTVSSNQDVLIVGFSTTETRLVYSGNDLNPFDFFLISSEFGSTSTFSAVNMGEGVITKGSRAYCLTTQTDSGRVDLDIPDQVFDVRLDANGNERFCAQRDFRNEWVYFTYPRANVRFRFPNQTLQYNYRDRTWATFNENYTTYGLFRSISGFIWSTVGNTFSSWETWNEPWNEAASSILKPEVAAGNQQGFFFIRDQGTEEAFSLAIQGFSGNVVTSIDHSLEENDYIIIDKCLGSISAQVNNRIFQVQNVTANTFQLSPDIDGSLGTYLGNGLIKKIYVPLIQTKQFPLAWGNARKTRLGVQQYLLTATNRSQIQLQIYLSQNASSFYNGGPIVPMPQTRNKSLIYSTVLYTCPESTNIGLTPSNVNLQMPTANNQAQIWHRMNTSLIGDSIQLGFSMSDEQLRALYPSGETLEITGMTNAYPAVFQVSGSDFNLNQLVTLDGLVGPNQLNGQVYNVLSSTDTTVTLNVDTTLMPPYLNSGIMTPVARYNQYAEIELHGFILDVTASQVLA